MYGRLLALCLSLSVASPALAGRLQVASAEASSIYTGEGSYTPAKVHDGKQASSWVEGDEGSGMGAWILLNLREPIPIPETGGRAQSVRFVGEYRCAQRQWRPVEGAWFARPNAQEPVHAERPRGGFRAAPAGTLDGAFLDAACGL